MGYNQMAGIKVAMGFKVSGKSMLDVRESVDTINDRDELVTLGVCPEGLKVYVKETKTVYVYNGTGWNSLGVAEVFKGATSESDGASGLVPAPKKEDVNKFLRADGTWAIPTAEGGAGSLEDLGVTATAQELNYVSGVTSSIQNQLNESIIVDDGWGSESSALPE